MFMFMYPVSIYGPQWKQTDIDRRGAETNKRPKLISHFFLLHLLLSLLLLLHLLFAVCLFFFCGMWTELRIVSRENKVRKNKTPLPSPCAEFSTDARLINAQLGQKKGVGRRVIHGPLKRTVLKECSKNKDNERRSSFTASLALIWPLFTISIPISKGIDS